MTADDLPEVTPEELATLDAVIADRLWVRARDYGMALWVSRRPDRKLAMRLTRAALQLGRVDEAEAPLAYLAEHHAEFDWRHLLASDRAVINGDLDAALASLDLVTQSGARAGAEARRTQIEALQSAAATRAQTGQPSGLTLWPGTTDRFFAAQPADRIMILAWEMSHNSAGRAATLADVLGDAPVAMAGPLLPSHGDALWGPLQAAPRAAPCLTWAPRDFAGFVDGALRLVRAYPAQTVWASKARFTSQFVAALYKHVHGAAVISDTDDNELAFVGGEAPVDLDGLLRHPAGPAWHMPVGRAWAEFAAHMTGWADAHTACSPHLARKRGAAVVRHARALRPSIAANARRADLRAAHGFAPDDRVVLFLGTPRRHKGLLRLAQALAQLGDPRVVLWVVGSPQDLALEAELTALDGLRLHRLPDQPLDRVPELNAAADLVCLLQDPENEVARHQTPAKLSDALAAGTPVLVTETPGLRDFVTNGLVKATTDLTLVDDLWAALAKDRPRQPLSEPLKRVLSLASNKRRAMGAIAAARQDPSPLPTEFARLLDALDSHMAGTVTQVARGMTTPALRPAGRTGRTLDPDQPLDIVMFWKQNDSGIYGRRQDMVLQALSRRADVGQILHIDAPLPAHRLTLSRAPETREEALWITRQTLARLDGSADELDIARRTLLTGPPTDGPMLGLPLHSPGHLAAMTETWMRELGMGQNCLAWTYPIAPGFDQVQARMRFPLVVSDFVDDQLTFPQRPDLRYGLQEAYQRAVSMADLAFVNCAPMAERIAALGGQAAVVPNGVDTSTPPPAEPHLAHLPRPIIGYVGNMNDRFDDALVAQLAMARPDASFVLVGKLDRATVRARLADLPNVHLLGVQPYDRARAIMMRMDIAIMPHLPGPMTDHMNPLKLYVYRSLGLPVVAAPVANTDDMRDGMVTVHDAPHWLAALSQVEQRLWAHGRPLMTETEAHAMSWDRRVDQMMQAIRAEIARRQSSSMSASR